MLRHVVLFTWTPEATGEQKQALLTELRKLPHLIPEVRCFDVGVDMGINPANFDFALVADFDDRAGYLVYRDHPAHRAIIDEHVNPIVASRAAAQYQTEDRAFGSP